MPLTVYLQDAYAKAEQIAADKSAALNARIAELEKLNAELQDQYLRKAADFDKLCDEADETPNPMSRQEGEL